MNELAQKWAVELKVKAMTAVSLLCGVGVAILNDVQADSSLIPGPAWAQAMVLVLVPTVTSFITGYQTKHSPRS
ncbi:holin [Streptomyces sp. H39-C1]|uniref:holin n=1 Tax=Streptomyces sp. H39-C1 TaxID=3004355 RepID=UPI0022AE5EE8|nr:holin [Streptomyces sp. H39-C1]MCZ4099836.1 holin [Streptomyces sp. H39-C1]